MSDKYGKCVGVCIAENGSYNDKFICRSEFLLLIRFLI